MFIAFHILMTVLAMVCAARWNLLIIDLPPDAMYRAIVLDVVRTGAIGLLFLFAALTYKPTLPRRGFWTVACLAATLYGLYFAVFLPSGMIITLSELGDWPGPQLGSALKFGMFGVWGYFLIFSLFQLRHHRDADREIFSEWD